MQPKLFLSASVTLPWYAYVVRDQGLKEQYRCTLKTIPTQPSVKEHYYVTFKGDVYEVKF